MSQNKIHEELRDVAWQDNRNLNSIIDSLFKKDKFLDEVLLDNMIIDVYDRYELKSPTENYFITSMNYKNGKRIIRSVSNQNNKIEYWNYFYDTGTIKRKGYTIGSILSIGIWEIYSETGELLNTIDYEAERLPFETIYKLIQDLQLSNNDLDFYYSKEESKWRIEDWSGKMKYFIDTNGNVHKEKFE
jgi:hypothetical protein